MKRIEKFIELMQHTGMEQHEIKTLAQHLEGSGFFTAPASTKYHGSYPGGLFDHSAAVAEVLLDLTEKLGLKWVDKRSPVLVGLFHDVCKSDKYIKVVDVPGIHMMGTNEVKGEEFHFENNPDVILPGHGDKSVMICATFFQLTAEEMLCIRYHMGAYETKDWDAYDKAIKQFPNVLFTHTADMIASKIVGI